MNGSLSKEQRRNLQKAMGPIIVDAIDGCREIAEQARGAVVTVHTQQQVLARTVTGLQAETESGLKKLHERVDGASSWAERAEQRANDVGNDLTRDKAAILERLEQLEERQQLIDAMDFFERIAWAFFRILPARVYAADHADAARAYPGDSI